MPGSFSLGLFVDCSCSGATSAGPVRWQEAPGAVGSSPGPTAADVAALLKCVHAGGFC